MSNAQAPMTIAADAGHPERSEGSRAYKPAQSGPISLSLRERVRVRGRQRTECIQPAAPPHPCPLREGEGGTAPTFAAVCRNESRQPSAEHHGTSGAWALVIGCSLGFGHCSFGATPLAQAQAPTFVWGAAEWGTVAAVAGCVMALPLGSGYRKAGTRPGVWALS